MPSSINYFTPIDHIATPDLICPYDLIAKYGHISVTRLPESLQGYTEWQISPEFFEAFPTTPDCWEYHEIQQGTFPCGETTEEDVQNCPFPFTRPDSLLPWLDQIARNAPRGWGLDGPYLSETCHPLSFDWRDDSNSVDEMSTDRSMESPISTPQDEEPWGGASPIGLD
ncbi:hypothetical protein OPQ81_002545 [Rhizoctonia solani]|nr:hypothetical protein OPQ81_002545 [Rhizoctonia solani]